MRSEYERLGDGEKGALSVLTEAGRLLADGLQAAQRGKCGEAQRHLFKAEHLWRTAESWSILYGSRTGRVASRVERMAQAERRTQKRVARMCGR